MQVKEIDKNTKTVFFDNGESIDYSSFYKSFVAFFNHRIAGQTLSPIDIERFMRRTSSKNLSQLVRAKKLEGYLEGSLDKMLTRGQKIAIATVVTIAFVGVILFVILKNQGLIPGM